jgi:hypothetical protein
VVEIETLLNVRRNGLEGIDRFDEKEEAHRKTFLFQGVRDVDDAASAEAVSDQDDAMGQLSIAVGLGDLFRSSAALVIAEVDDVEALFLELLVDDSAEVREITSPPRGSRRWWRDPSWIFSSTQPWRAARAEGRRGA